VKFDCRYYRGEKPCRFKRECKGCPHYEPMGTRFLIIKLAAAGDVLRTTPLLHAIKRKHERSWVVWVTDAFSVPLLENNPYIDRLLPYGHDATVELMGQKFDVLMCLDKEPRAIGLANIVSAKEKLGFRMTEHGTLGIFNPEATYALALGLSDPLKFYQNQKSYQQIIFEAVGYEFRGERYILNLTDEAKAQAKAKLRALGVAPNEAVGVNTGAGKVFATKKWPEEHLTELVRLLRTEGIKVLLLGGPEEVERNKRIKAGFASDDGVVDAGTDNPLDVFCAIVSLCRLVVTVDTMALHIAVALGVPVIALFGPTCHQEVDLYGRGEKLVGKAPCAPCYRASCDDPICMKSITPRQVLEAVKRWISA